MGHETLVAGELDDGETLIREFDHVFSVKAAFWLQESDESHRYLCLASDAIDETNFDLAYREIVGIDRRLKFQWLDILRVKVLYGSDPRAAAAADLILKYPERLPTRLRDAYLGDRYVDELYLYPPLHAASGSS